MPFFSVVIPTYNRALFLPGTIDSVLAQDYDDFEIVVVDDGSTDGTAEVIETNYACETKVRYYKQPNSERGAARNNGFKQARSPYVVFLDSDDLMHTDHLSTLAKIVAEHPDANFLATKFAIVRDGRRQATGLEAITEGWHGLELFLHGDPIGSVFCVNKNNPKIKLFEEDRRYAVMEDWMFLVENLAGERIYIRDEITITVVDHAERSMRSDNRAIIEKKLLAAEWITSRVSLSEPQKRILRGYAFYFCAIHSYLDRDRKAGLGYLRRAALLVKPDVKLFTLCLKILLGFDVVQKAKNSRLLLSRDH